MSAYYNEHEPFAAEWLRQLIKANLIAPGEVDERDIQQVNPADLRGFTQCHFFAGIGVWSYSLRAAGWPDDSRVWTGSCPCQGFSASGKREGFSDQRHLWPAWFRLIRECAPGVVFGEQVASKDGLAWFDVVSADMEGQGYAIGAADTCAAGFGAPHIRSRLYFVADAGREQDRQPGHSRSSEQGSHGQDNGLSGGSGDELRESMADANQSHASAERLQRSGQLGRTAEDDRLFAMADAGRRSVQRQRIAGEFHRSSPADGTETQSRAIQTRPSGDGETGDLGDTSRERFPNSESQELSRARRTGERRTVAEPSRSFWADAEWLWCRDQKYRPVEAGTFPLAHGVAKRVGKLRGFGNALVAPQAQGFIEAYLAI